MPMVFSPEIGKALGDLRPPAVSIAVDRIETKDDFWSVLDVMEENSHRAQLARLFLTYNRQCSDDEMRMLLYGDMAAFQDAYSSVGGWFPGDRRLVEQARVYAGEVYKGAEMMAEVANAGKTHGAHQAYCDLFHELGRAQNGFEGGEALRFQLIDEVHRRVVYREDLASQTFRENAPYAAVLTVLALIATLGVQEKVRAEELSGLITAGLYVFDAMVAGYDTWVAGKWVSRI